MKKGYRQAFLKVEAKIEGDKCSKECRHLDTKGFILAYGEEPFCYAYLEYVGVGLNRCSYCREEFKTIYNDADLFDDGMEFDDLF